MDAIRQFFAQDPFWLWLVIGAVVLGVEVATGTGWLLWAAVSAGVVGLLALFAPNVGFPLELGLFAVLTIATSLLARRFLPRAFVQPGHDINDNVARIVGERGFAVTSFTAGVGRVSIDGKEWAAEVADGKDIGLGAALAVGTAVKVVAVQGSRLVVQPL